MSSEPSKGLDDSLKFSNNKSLQAICLKVLPYRLPEAHRPGCFKCSAKFGVTNVRRHCRSCGDIYCSKCAPSKMLLPLNGDEYKQEVRVCEFCLEHVNQGDLNSYLRYMGVLKSDYSAGDKVFEIICTVYRMYTSC